MQEVNHQLRSYWLQRSLEVSRKLFQAIIDVKRANRKREDAGIALESIQSKLIFVSTLMYLHLAKAGSNHTY